MLVKSVASAVVLAVVAHAEAARHGPMPYRVARMPVSSLLGGLVRRDNPSGYHPETEVCGSGDTCAQACGAGYQQCASNDSANHCFDPAAGDTCCGTGTGDACETGYYCAHDGARNTVCCPSGMDAAACAGAVGASGAVTPDSAGAAGAASTPAPAPTSAPAPAPAPPSSVPVPSPPPPPPPASTPAAATTTATVASAESLPSPTTTTSTSASSSTSISTSTSTSTITSTTSILTSTGTGIVTPGSFTIVFSSSLAPAIPTTPSTFLAPSVSLGGAASPMYTPTGSGVASSTEPTTPAAPVPASATGNRVAALALVAAFFVALL